eukprot:SAG31_NODE_20175_length_581_cov_3.062241_1_plen_33_part_10
MRGPSVRVVDRARHLAAQPGACEGMHTDNIGDL